ncbi:hypothetical protein FA15DRAFT_245798 [Coprinopsis marcescibilis]|uniref:Transmembrane protein n=1 Tax=Coprinopsis marcescibilis TaxID=230819 RepID=A0A5C3LEP7_COPMA|nr:hypothetical protein FA15DRAFT_245798 [Coprinopsis marcescibilis]
MATTPPLGERVLLIFDDTSPQFQWSNFSSNELSVVYPTGDDAFAMMAPRHNSTSSMWNEGNGSNPPVSPFTRMVTFMFQGTAAAFCGSFFPYDEWNAGTWRIDDGDRVSFRGVVRSDFIAAERGLGQWFTTPTLPDGDHTIEFRFQYGRGEIDYAVVTGGRSAQYDHQTTLIVDDDTPSEIFYFGQWEKQKTGFDIIGSSGRYNFPFHNATHATGTVGSGFRFRFSGTSLRIFGFTRLAEEGSFDLTYTIDNEEPETRKHRAPYVPEGLKDFLTLGNGEMDLQMIPNWLLAEYTSLEPGEHVITVELSRLEGPQMFSFDYLTYSPSFPNLASKPLYSVADLDYGQPIQQPQANKGQDKVPIIVGSVVGASAFVILLLGIAFMPRRRNRTASLLGSEEPKEKPAGTIDPFDSGLNTALRANIVYRKDNSEFDTQRLSQSSMTQVGDAEGQDDVYQTSSGDPKTRTPITTEEHPNSSRSLIENGRRSLDTYLAPPTYRSGFD